MIIKAWNSYDMSVFKINHAALAKLLKDTKEKFTDGETKQLRQIEKEFGEKLGLEFSHNLKRGWEGKLLNEGRVLDRKGKELITVKEVKAAFQRDGKIEFFAYGKFKSLSIVEKLKKPAHLCWS